MPDIPRYSRRDPGTIPPVTGDYGLGGLLPGNIRSILGTQARADPKAQADLMESRRQESMSPRPEQPKYASLHALLGLRFPVRKK